MYSPMLVLIWLHSARSLQKFCGQAYLLVLFCDPCSTAGSAAGVT